MSNKLKFYLFADDTNIYLESDNLNELEKVANNELKHLSLWLKVNRLALNISKTNYVIFHSSQRKLDLNITIKLDKKALTQKEHIKYLGVIIDSHLNWKQHIQTVSNKISRSIGIMYRLRNYINLKNMKSIYYSLIYSHIYAIHVWGSANITDLEKIIILQKKAVRMMLFMDQYPQLPGPLNPSEPLFKKLEILKIHDVFKLHVTGFIYGCFGMSTPCLFWNWFSRNCHFHTYNTISNSIINMTGNFEIVSVTQTNILHILHTQHFNLHNYGAKMLKVAGPLIWNSLPDYIRNSDSIHNFKLNLKKFLLSQYSSASISLTGHYYVSKLSIDFMKLKISKMHSFFIPPLLALSNTPGKKHIHR